MASSDTLLARVDKLEAECKALREENNALKKNDQLKRRLGQDSTNSSKPPSSDHSATKPSVQRSLRKPSGRKPGKQPGSGGTAQAAAPGHTVDHYPPTCRGCQRDLDAARPAGVRRCQVFDLPEPAGWEVTEHRYHRMRCARGTTTVPTPCPESALLPPTVPGSARRPPT